MEIGPPSAPSMNADCFAFRNIFDGPYVEAGGPTNSRMQPTLAERSIGKTVTKTTLELAPAILEY